MFWTNGSIIAFGCIRYGFLVYCIHFRMQNMYPTGSKYFHSTMRYFYIWYPTFWSNSSFSSLPSHFQLFIQAIRQYEQWKHVYPLRFHYRPTIQITMVTCRPIVWASPFLLICNLFLVMRTSIFFLSSRCKIIKKLLSHNKRKGGITISQKKRCIVQRTIPQTWEWLKECAPANPDHTGMPLHPVGVERLR